MTDRSLSRRRVLAGIAVPAAGALAGCGGLLSRNDTQTPTAQPLTELRGRAVYVDPALSLSVPDIADAVDSPAAADVVVLPADTDRSPSAIVHWLAADRHVALVGEEAQTTWHEVKESGAYAAMLGDPQAMAAGCSSSTTGVGGSGGGEAGGTATDCEPPDMLVAARHPEAVTTTYRATWEGVDEPGSRRVFAGIDDALAG